MFISSSTHEQPRWPSAPPPVCDYLRRKTSMPAGCESCVPNRVASGCILQWKAWCPFCTMVTMGWSAQLQWRNLRKICIYLKKKRFIFFCINNLNKLLARCGCGLRGVLQWKTLCPFRTTVMMGWCVQFQFGKINTVEKKKRQSVFFGTFTSWKDFEPQHANT